MSTLATIRRAYWWGSCRNGMRLHVAETWHIRRVDSRNEPWPREMPLADACRECGAPRPDNALHNFGRVTTKP